MAQLYDRNTGLPVTTPSANDNVAQSKSGGTTQTTGPRTDTSSAAARERTVQSAESIQNAVNTTPAVLAALDTLVLQLSGRPAITTAAAEQQIPLLERVTTPGLAPTPFSSPGYKASVRYRDPKTGRVYSEQDARIENDKRIAQRKVLIEQGSEAIAAGTPEQRQQQEERQLEIQRNRARQGEYSKTAAFGDAQALVNKAIADALDAVLPSINRASEGAGSSRNAIRALLTQQAAEKGAVEGAALGAQTSVAYGGLQNQLASTLELLTRSDPNSPASLLIQAIVGSKGLVQNSSGNQTTTSDTTKQQDTTTNVGPQTTQQNSLEELLRQTLAPLSALQQETSEATRAPAVPAITSPRGSGGIARTNAPSVESVYRQVSTPTEDVIYGINDEI